MTRPIAAFKGLRLVLAVVIAAASRAASQEFRLGFNELVQRTCLQNDGSFLMLSTLAGSANGKGPQVWSIAIKSPAGRRFGNVTLEGTDAESAINEGFVFHEVTGGEGNEGLVSIVALSLTSEKSLPGSFRPQSILAFGVEGKPGDRVFLEYAAELRSSAGLVRNVVNVDKRPFFPELTSSLPLLESGLYVGFSLTDIDSPFPFDDLIGGRDGRDGVVEIPATAGVATDTRVFGCIASAFQHPDSIVQGWSLSVGIDGDAAITEATIRGTATEHYFTGGFNKTEVVDPGKNGGARGVVSAMIPGDFVAALGLPREGTYSVLEIGLRADPGVCGVACTTQLKYRDGLRGSGQPVQNLITVGGSSVIPCNLNVASATIRVLEGNRRFQRGNVNGDARLDISDVAFLLNAIFAGGPDSRCREATDANKDGFVDISDPVHVFRYLFFGTGPPAPPFPGCGFLEAGEPSLGCFESPEPCR